MNIGASVVVKKNNNGLSKVFRHFAADGHIHLQLEFSVVECCMPIFEPNKSSELKKKTNELSWI